MFQAGKASSLVLGVRSNIRSSLQQQYPDDSHTTNFLTIMTARAAATPVIALSIHGGGWLILVTGLGVWLGAAIAVGIVGEGTIAGATASLADDSTMADEAEDVGVETGAFALVSVGDALSVSLTFVISSLNPNFSSSGIVRLISLDSPLSPPSSLKIVSLLLPPQPVHCHDLLSCASLFRSFSGMVIPPT